MWTWKQAAGELWRAGGIVARGYSGLKLGKNNPAMEGAKGVGPIPEGRWRIVGGPYHSGNTGPYTLALQPEPGTNTFGRGDFRIHGDSIAHPGAASHGCIILARAVREQIWTSGEREFEIVA
ncbi:tlde1 domain-containing protein [uncultured Sphingomonas sp.]|uniref:tlde1 domain-containing protein n=1 Tax=uncultured Sphingomonas sp. TaxID=158754 RepID=UPI0035CC5BFB